jgi:outer membrane protein OmpA-like peptidoglycan-associated protein
MIGLGLLCVARIAGAQNIIDDIPRPPGYVIDPDPELTAFGVQAFEAAGEKQVTVEGKRAVFSAHVQPPDSMDDARSAALWKATWEKAGWRIEKAPPEMVARKTVHGTEVWIHSSIFGSSDCRFQMVEKGTRGSSLKLDPPAGDAAKTPAGKDFPFLQHFPGMRLGGDAGDTMIDVAAEGEESHLVGPVATRLYGGDVFVGAHEIGSLYREALQAAGWKIVNYAEPSDMQLIAHYGRDGHDIWTLIHGGGKEMSISVADVGAQSAAARLAEELKKKGHVAIYGIYFDTDSAKLKPESDAALQQILTLLKQDAGLRLEIQGHTDSTGERPHNQKLSEARAASVRTWLVSAKVAAARMTTVGFADTKPVASNDDPNGRALNRRVELVKR